MFVPGDSASLNHQETPHLIYEDGSSSEFNHKSNPPPPPPTPKYRKIKWHLPHLYQIGQYCVKCSRMHYPCSNTHHYVSTRPRRETAYTQLSTPCHLHPPLLSMLMLKAWKVTAVALHFLKCLWNQKQERNQIAPKDSKTQEAECQSLYVQVNAGWKTNCCWLRGQNKQVSGYKKGQWFWRFLLDKDRTHTTGQIDGQDGTDRWTRQTGRVDSRTDRWTW